MSRANAITARPALDEVADGILRLDLPVPFKGLRQINLWFLRDGDGWVMIDCGWGDEASRRAISAAWAALPGGGAVTRLLITHFHPDHIGNSRWIADEWGLEPLMSAQEWIFARRSAALEGLDNVPAQYAWFRKNGLPEPEATTYRDEFLPYDQGVALPDRVALIAEGDVLKVGERSFQVLTGGGHSPDMVMLHDPVGGLFIAGDQILPRISSNISVGHWAPDDDPLAAYMASLHRLAALLPETTLILPSHGEPFRGGAARARALVDHHHDRLDAILATLRERQTMTAADFLPILFPGRLDGTQIGFAIGEVAAHLNHLLGRGDIVRLNPSGGITAYAPAFHPGAQTRP